MMGGKKRAASQWSLAGAWGYRDFLFYCFVECLLEIKMVFIN
jgi:hypothetical protein